MSDSSLQITKFEGSKQERCVVLLLLSYLLYLFLKHMDFNLVLL